MRSTSTTMSIAEYKEQFDNRQIKINRDYQRSDKVWPTAAKSNLVDTILNGYPIPKILLSQTTDLDTLKSVKEVVDGQQRSITILLFLENNFALTRGAFRGNHFRDLDQEQKRAFIDYNLSIDVFSSATKEDIREVFRRINSYQIPLNSQETRHAIFQGEFKWFIHEMGQRYATALLKAKVVSEKQIARMADLEFLTELAQLCLRGIKTSGPTLLNNMYRDYDRSFPEKTDTEYALEVGIGKILDMPEIHGTDLSNRSVIYALVGAELAIHDLAPGLRMETIVKPERRTVSKNEQLANITVLGEALSSILSDDDPFQPFKAASTAGTNTEKNRRTRFEWFYRALTEQQL